jgi:geranylgeranyl pyrophosphate synthase
MRDDLLDITGDGGCTGKPRGVDLRDGTPSLPIVLALGRHPEVRRIFALPQPSAAEVETGLARIRRAGVLRRVAERACVELEAARAMLAVLPASPYRTTLDAFVVGLGPPQGVAIHA